MPKNIGSSKGVPPSSEVEIPSRGEMIAQAIEGKRYPKQLSILYHQGFAPLENTGSNPYVFMYSQSQEQGFLLEKGIGMFCFGGHFIVDSIQPYFDEKKERCFVVRKKNKFFLYDFILEKRNPPLIQNMLSKDGSFIDKAGASRAAKFYSDMEGIRDKTLDILYN